MKPNPIDTLPQEPGFRFIGLILGEDREGNPMWDIDHYKFVSWPNLMNLNIGIYTPNALRNLTHWLPEPEFPS